MRSELSAIIGLQDSEERSRQEGRMRALTTVGSPIAHEMRTPLLGIRYDASGLQDYLPRLIDAHEWAVTHGWDESVGAH